ncbi:mini-chromosome maintenance complex-binding protein-like isoform X1 [Morus notabilis]|uniref:mini-chromosome maintenance complex-binding protein-like isoform X1 n=1 Tax=Morus notabilis TaxID=981085 RepID=UPI000CED5D6A|nr:mini-chromosome maintenance complex-binding protein-like isoform X1 [Morus notabilis]XP_024030186.1 mini-chromosome maintenance complex-binding protein-like isoform X1 [Morus notabilis]XP_024030188.1 mini-chromosome maintenance complex-binding protein-like isoform X1 [Morus notabilis]XP_024030189.1 mini-chromosome maintenance complex-binding protein-like isoform X1 [Morus notabilis]XP_024030190.1 mini-chromosome maintenance complex-binding protein-like isoform X1 [Morus notabilis]
MARLGEPTSIWIFRKFQWILRRICEFGNAVCSTVPGLNSWAEASPEALIKRSMELASQQREKRQRGDDEAVDDMDLVVSNDGFEGSPSAKKMREDGHPSQSSQSQESVSQGACSSASVQPNVDRDSLPCLVKICDIPESDLKLNEVVEFIGVLTLVSQHQVDKDEYDDFENGFMGDELTPLPPRNEVPHLHCLIHRKLAVHDFLQSSPMF